MTKPRQTFISCFDCPECIAGVVKKGARMRDANEELEGRAGELGWVIGLTTDGQAHYGCPCCGVALLNGLKLRDSRPAFRQLFRRALVSEAR